MNVCTMEDFDPVSYGVGLFAKFHQNILSCQLYFDNSKNIVDKGVFLNYCGFMDKENAAKKLAELGHITRLSIFRLLVKAGDEGLPVGQIQESLGVPGSTLSHHISRLVSVGLVKQVRESRTLYCIPQYAVLNELIDFLKSECCTDDQCNM